MWAFFNLPVKRKLARWLYVLSAIIHAALYPFSLACIIIGFWKYGLWRGLAIMVYFTVATVLARFLIVGGFGLLISLLDPAFFDE